jgi:hypothetical protein
MNDYQAIRLGVRAACGEMSPEQRELVVRFIWLSVHAPESARHHLEQKLRSTLLDYETNADGITHLLRTCVDELTAALGKVWH